MPIRPEGRIELGLYVGRTQAGTGHPVTANTAQTDQAFIHGCPQTRGFHRQPGTRAVIVKVEYRTLAIYQADGGAVCNAIPIAIHPGYAVLQTQSVLAAQQQWQRFIKQAGVTVRQCLKLGGLQLRNAIHGHYLDAEHHITVTVHPLQLGRAHGIESNCTAIGRRQVGLDTLAAHAHKTKATCRTACAISTIAATAGKERQQTASDRSGGLCQCPAHIVTDVTIIHIATVVGVFLANSLVQAHRQAAQVSLFRHAHTLAWNIIQHCNIQSSAGRISIIVRQSHYEVFTQLSVVSRLLMSFVIKKGIAIGH